MLDSSSLLTHGVQWNCYDYPTVHWDGTLVFIIGVALSAIFQTLEVWQLNKGHEERKHLKRNTYFKLAIVAGDVILATAFGATYMYVSTLPDLFSFFS